MRLGGGGGGADNKELKRNRLAESEKRKEEAQEGQCMNYTFSPQSEVPALFMSPKKSPHSGAGIVLCPLWNSIAVHLILNDFEVSPRHPRCAAHTDAPPHLSGMLLLQVLCRLMMSRSAVAPVKRAVAVTRAPVTTWLALHCMTMRLNRMYPSHGVRRQRR